METLFRHNEIGMIINPNAGRVAKNVRKSRFFWENYLDESMTEITPDIPAIEPALKRLKEKNIKVLAIYGGDGTFQKTLTAAFNVWEKEEMPPVLPLKGGTANALVKNMGIKKKAKNYMNRFWKFASRNKVEKVELFEVPMLKVDDSSNGHCNYGFIFTNGLAYKSIEQYQSAQNPGMWDVFRTGIYPVIAYYIGMKGAKDYFQQPHMNIELVMPDNEYSYSGPVNVALCSTLKKLLLWYAPFRGSITGTNGFYCLINHMELDDLFDNFMALARGRMEAEGHINAVARNLKIGTDSGYMIDGELFRRSEPYELELTRGPSIQVVVLPV